MTDDARDKELRQFVRDFDLIITGRYLDPKRPVVRLLDIMTSNLKRLTDEKHPPPTRLRHAMIDVWAVELLQFTKTPETWEAFREAAVTVGASVEADWNSEAQLTDMISHVEETIRIWGDDVRPGVSPEEIPTWAAQKHRMDMCLWWANVLLEACRRGWTAGERLKEGG